MNQVLTWAQLLFYIFGILFFLIIIIAAFIFIRKTTQTAKIIRKVLTSNEIENLIASITPLLTPRT